MIEPLRHVRRLFDALDNATSDETAEHGVYADTRPSEGVYAVANTQSAESTYRAGEGTESDELVGDAEQFDCPDPATCSTCHPASVAD